MVIAEMREWCVERGHSSYINGRGVKTAIRPSCYTVRRRSRGSNIVPSSRFVCESEGRGETKQHFTTQCSRVCHVALSGLEFRVWVYICGGGKAASERSTAGMVREGTSPPPSPIVETLGAYDKSME